MKKLTLLTILAWLIAVALMPAAKAQTVEKGEKFLNAVLSIGVRTSSYSDSYGSSRDY